MKKLLIACVALFLMIGCSTGKTIPTVSDNRDSVRVEIRERTIFVKDTVLIEIPAQSTSRTTDDSVSHLETDFASSDARINSDGTLFHNLKNKEQQKEIPIENKEEYRDSIVYRDKVVYKETTKEIERDYSWWDKTRFYGFYGLLILLAITYRKKIFNVIVGLIH